MPRSDAPDDRPAPGDESWGGLDAALDTRPALSGGLPPVDRLSRPLQAVVKSSAAADVVLRTGVAGAVMAALAPYALARGSGGGPEHELDRLAYYADLARRGDAAVSFPAPVAPAEVRVRAELPLPLWPRDGKVESLRFDSPFVPLHADVADEYLGLTGNLTARAQHWRHADGPRPTLCVIHGFMASPYAFNSAFFSLPWFYGQGYDVLLFTLPFHGGRRERGSIFNGSGLFSHGLSVMNEAMAHAVHDFRLFVDHLFETGVPRVGVTGLSLGGYTSALLAAAEPRLHLAVPNAAVTDIAGLADSWWPLGQLMRGLMQRRGIEQAAIFDALAFHSPLSYPAAITRDRLFVIAGLGDRLAPPEQSQALWEHWGRPDMHWFPGNHVLHVNRAAYLRQMGRFFNRTGFLDGVGA